MAGRDLAGLEKKARRERKTLIFVDESGFYLLPGIVRTYGPKGQTPIVEEWQSRDHLSVMSGLTQCGRLLTYLRPTALHAQNSVAFLRHLQRHLGSRLLVIWDGSPIHRGREVKQFLAAGAARTIHLEILPAYAPELNPVEWLWQHVKHVALRNHCCLDLEELHYYLRLALQNVRRKPCLIQSFFDGAQL